VARGGRPTPSASVGQAGRQLILKVLHMAEVLNPPSATPPKRYIYFT
jgi:hypothetical protein